MTMALHPKPAGAFRLLHTADWHLGKLLNDRSREEEHRRFLLWLIDAVQDHQVDVILVAGDVFDTANPPNSALEQYYSFVAALHRAGGCSLVVIAGNHDSAAQLEAPRRALQSLGAYVVGALPVAPEERLIPLPSADAPRVVVAAVPFLRDRDLRIGRAGETYDDIQTQLVQGIERVYTETASAYRERFAATGAPLLGMGHLTVLGAAPSDSERAIHIGGLGSVPSNRFPDDFAAILLGHLHRPQNPGGANSACSVWYSGSPIPLSFSEAEDQKQVLILDVNPQGSGELWGTTSVTPLPTPATRRLVQLRTAAGRIEETLAAFDPNTAELPTWVEVIVSEASTVDDLSARVTEAAAGLPFEVVRVVRADRLVPDAAERDTSGLSDAEVIESLTDDPRRVFEELLTRETSLEPARAESLRTAFARLLDRYHQQQESGATR
ncbi:MAG: exonuclease subunit SbcD [Spirochaetaceae bacterium]|nr:MAG: exonuclease subunit SbcD [Spirochaetaceae bacterium]